MITFKITEPSRTSIAGRLFGSADTTCKHGLSHMSYRERKEAEKKIVEDKTRSERMKILEVI